MEGIEEEPGQCIDVICIGRLEQSADDGGVVKASRRQLGQSSRFGVTPPSLRAEAPIDVRMSQVDGSVARHCRLASMSW